ncbi:hypothetical protein GW17_00005585 [Ensete ventricosum]|nr:hypothetical protein GW17_00005585 [Ensete ventricosum]
MSQECSASANLGEDAPLVMHTTSRGVPQLLPPLPLFRDENSSSRTLGRYWHLFNDPRLTPPPLSLEVPAVTPEAFQGLTNQIREKGLLKVPNPMRNVGRDRGRYCRFHRDYRHDTKECYDLKNHIEDLIRWGHLNRFIRRSPSLCPKGLVEKQIDVIVGGLPTSDDSSSARKAYAYAEVQKRPHAQSNPEITFESEGEYPDHDDAMVIMACIANAHVKHIMIDTGSSTDIRYFDAFLKLGITNRDLIPMTSTLTGNKWMTSPRSLSKRGDDSRPLATRVGRLAGNPQMAKAHGQPTGGDRSWSTHGRQGRMGST